MSVTVRYAKPQPACWRGPFTLECLSPGCPVQIIWDVGHQAYGHKILTGRRNRMHTIRQTGGLSGFTKRGESEYDPFGAGHSSTSVSAALGMAVGRDFKVGTRCCKECWSYLWRGLTFLSCQQVLRLDCSCIEWTVEGSYDSVKLSDTDCTMHEHACKRCCMHAQCVIICSADRPADRLLSWYFVDLQTGNSRVDAHVNLQACCAI